MSETSSAPSAEELAQKEKTAARTIELGKYRWVLAGAVALWVITLFLPSAGNVTGWQVLVGTGGSSISIAERIYAVLICVGIGVLTTLTVITRRTALALLAWMFTTVSIAYAIFSLWLRQTRSTPEDGMNSRIGVYLTVLAVIVVVYVYSRTALRRSPEQDEIAHQRADHDNLDEVGRAQRDVLEAEHMTFETNPLFIDDRRQRAAERYKAHRN